jgi:membrane-associated protein
VPVTALGPSWLDPNQLVETFGLIGTLIVIFAECGLLIGFFLPGDSLLFTAGLFAVSEAGLGGVPLWVVCLVLVVAALAGNVCGYWIGRLSGPAIFDKPQSKLFKPKHVARTHEFFEKYGNRAIVLGRFVPIVRTFVPFVAGAGAMTYATFAFYNVVGAILWVGVCVSLGYVFGNVPIVKQNFSLVMLGIIFVSVLPAVYEVLKHRRSGK